MVGIIISVATVAFVFFLLWRDAEASIKRHETSLSWYKNWFRARQGSLCSYGNYHIASFDCGRTWYDVETTDDPPVVVIPGRLHAGRFGYKILRPASEDLLAELKKWDDLSKLVWKTS